jgi:signal peptidase II
MRRARIVPFLAIALFCVGCDHAVKIAAESLLEARPPVELAGGIVRFELAYNGGAFLSLGSGLPLAVRNAIFGVGVPLGVVLVSLLALRDSTLRMPTLVALALLAGGGIANGIDRLMSGGYVTDFVSIGFGPLRTGIFNVADVAVMAGAIALALFGFVSGRDTPEPTSAP